MAHIPFTFRGDDPRPWQSIPVGPAAGIPGAEPHMLRDLARRMEDAVKAGRKGRWQFIDPAFARLARAVAVQMRRPCDDDFAQEIMWACAGLIEPGGMENPRLGYGIDRYNPGRGIRVRSYWSLHEMTPWITACPERLITVQEAYDVATPYRDFQSLIRQAVIEETRMVAYWLREAFRERIRMEPPADRASYTGTWEILVTDYDSLRADLVQMLDGAAPFDLPVMYNLPVPPDYDLCYYRDYDYCFCTLYDSANDAWVVVRTDLRYDEDWYRLGQTVELARWSRAVPMEDA